jgi:putative ABC transport system substrate-binding protein
LAKLGWIDGQNLQIIHRYSHGDVERHPVLAAELVALEPDVLFGTTTDTSIALARATTRIPVVMTGPPDPVAMGLVKSLARPGGNVTGTATATGAFLFGKRIGILRQWLPHLSRIAVMYNPRDPFDSDGFARLQDEASQSGLRVDPMSVGNLAEFRGAIDALSKQPPDAIYVFTGAFNYTNRDMICGEVLLLRLPAMTSNPQFVESGCLASYAGSLDELIRENARFVDQILRGAKPADIPVRQPTRFEFVINAKTARSLGLAIPSSLRVIADRVIE